jgi:hypothetical protein
MAGAVVVMQMTMAGRQAQHGKQSKAQQMMTSHCVLLSSETALTLTCLTSDFL